MLTIYSEDQVETFAKTGKRSNAYELIGRIHGLMNNIDPRWVYVPGLNLKSHGITYLTGGVTQELVTVNLEGGSTYLISGIEE